MPIGQDIKINWDMGMVLERSWNKGRVAPRNSSNSKLEGGEILTNRKEKISNGPVYVITV